MRNKIICYINGTQEVIEGKNAFMTVAQYLRYQKSLTGTKVVCSEGDCGACTILISRYVNGEMTKYQSVNSCISYMYLMDRCHIVTVEGLGSIESLHPVQEEMVKHHGAQCGYCTPGFICAMANMTEDVKQSASTLTEQKAKNYLTGNLCRCTGYEPIIKAATEIDINQVKLLGDIYCSDQMLPSFNKIASEALLIKDDNKEVYLPVEVDDALRYQAENNSVKITSGATDLGVLQNKGKLNIIKTLSLNNIDEAYNIKEVNGHLEIGAKASLTNVEKACESHFPEFARKLHIFASPQIKNKGTLVGNLVNASPIGDSIPFLRVAEANVVLENSTGKRVLNINDFYKGGYKELDLKENEIVTRVQLPLTSHEYKLYKVSIRKDLDISSVTFACRYKIENGVIKDISFAYGGVGPVVLRLTSLELKAKGQKFEKNLFKELAEDVKNEITPMSDLRGTKEFRKIVSSNLMLKFFDEVTAELSNNQVEASL